MPKDSQISEGRSPSQECALRQVAHCVSTVQNATLHDQLHPEAEETSMNPQEARSQNAGGGCVFPCVHCVLQADNDVQVDEGHNRGQEPLKERQVSEQAAVHQYPEVEPSTSIIDLTLQEAEQVYPHSEDQAGATSTKIGAQECIPMAANQHDAREAETSLMGGDTSTSSNGSTLYFDCEDAENSIVLASSTVPIGIEDTKGVENQSSILLQVPGGIPVSTPQALTTDVSQIIPTVSLTQDSIAHYFSDRESVPTATILSAIDSASFRSVSPILSRESSDDSDVDMLYTPPEQFSELSSSPFPRLDPLSNLSSRARFLFWHMTNRQEIALSQGQATTYSPHAREDMAGGLAELEVESQGKWTGVPVSEMARVIRNRYGSVNADEIEYVTRSLKRIGHVAQSFPATSSTASPTRV